MKIGFMNPGTSKTGIPFGIAYMVAYLEKHNKDMEIKVFDSAYGDPQGFIKEYFDVIGLSLCYTSYRQGIEVAEKIKKLHPKTKIVVGGPQVTSIIAKSLDESVFDYAIYGEGEITINEFLNAVKDGSDVTKIDGLIYREGDKVIVNKPRAYIQDLNTLPFPALHHFNMDNYNSYYLLSSRGCPFGCVFCASSIWGRKWRKRSAENMVEEIESILCKYPKNLFIFNDESFNMDIPRVEAFCDLLMARNIKIAWTCQGVRADKIEPGVVKKMARAGCVGMGVGIESANPQVLKNIKKQVTIEQIERAVKIILRAGIYEISGLFMVGNPGDTKETIMESVEFAKRMNFSLVWFTPAVPLPCTELITFIKEHGKFTGTEDCTNYREDGDYSKEYAVHFETPDFPKEDRVAVIKYLVKLRFADYLARESDIKKKIESGDLSEDTQVRDVQVDTSARENLKRKLLGFKWGNFEIGYYLYLYVHRSNAIYQIFRNKYRYFKVDYFENGKEDIAALLQKNKKD